MFDNLHDMQERMMLSRNLRDFVKIALVSVLLGIFTIPVFVTSYSCVNGAVLLHKTIPQSNNSSVHHRINAVPLLQELLLPSKSAYESRREDNNKRNCEERKDNSYTVPKDKKLLHKTFRIPEDTIDALEKEAKFRDIPLSNLVNRILKNYLTAEIHSERSGFILTSKDFFRRLFNKIDENFIEEYGREVGYAIADEYTYLHFPNINNYTIIQFLESWFERFQSYQHRFDKENNRHDFSLNHDININFSIVLEKILQGLIEPVTKSQVIFGELRSSSISFSFEV